MTAVTYPADENVSYEARSVIPGSRIRSAYLVRDARSGLTVGRVHCHEDGRWSATKGSVTVAFNRRTRREAAEVLSNG